MLSFVPERSLLPLWATLLLASAQFTALLLLLLLLQKHLLM
jgi:hypothetical protein